MNSIDRQIKAAEKDLGAFAQGGWLASEASWKATDRMHALLVSRADAMMGCTENSPEEAELAELTDAIEAYEAMRWRTEKLRGARASRRRDHERSRSGPTLAGPFLCGSYGCGPPFDCVLLAISPKERAGRRYIARLEAR